VESHLVPVVKKINTELERLIGGKDGNGNSLITKSSAGINDANKLTYTYEVKNKKNDLSYWSFTFNPKDIASITLDNPWVTDETTIRRIKIRLSRASCTKITRSWDHLKNEFVADESEQVDQFYVGFRYANDSDFEQLKTLFLQLQSEAAKK
jgi:hypothetical protein